MVNCVLPVERRHHVALRIRTCHEVEVYFRVGCGKATKAVPFLEMVHQRTEGPPILRPDLCAVLAIVGDGFEERMIGRACVDDGRWFHRTFHDTVLYRYADAG